MSNKAKKVLTISLVIGFCSLILGLVFKGAPDVANNTLQYQDQGYGIVGGPFESTNSTSRYILTQAIVRDGRFTLTEQEARSAAPDLVYHNGVFQSIFTPGISLAAAPLYAYADRFGLPQVGAFLLNVIFAIINVTLIYVLTRKLGGNHFASLIASVVFLCGTNALAYALTLTQHHGSMMVLLMACILAFSKFSWKTTLGFGMLCGIGLLFDFPNLFLLLPIGLWFITKSFAQTVTAKTVTISWKPAVLLIAIGFMPFIAFLGWYNIQVAGSPVKVAQFLGRTNYFDTQAKKDSDALAAAEDAKNPYRPQLPFQTRIQLDGVQALGISNERSWLYYSPVLLFGFLGAYYLIQKSDRKGEGVLLLSIVVFNFIIYSMFSDPWGGWSFGARYLLPGAALMSVFVGIALTHYRHKLITAFFYVLMIYSVAISMAGALTSAAIPPKQEAINLDPYVPYTFRYNFDFLEQHRLSSLAFNSWQSPLITADKFYYSLVIGSLAVTLILLLAERHSKIK